MNLNWGRASRANSFLGKADLTLPDLLLCYSFIHPEITIAWAQGDVAGFYRRRCRDDAKSLWNEILCESLRLLYLSNNTLSLILISVLVS